MDDESQAQFGRWKAELDHAQKDNKYTDWLTECDKITRRYRDQRDDTKTTTLTSNRRFNLFWSNVQTLMPAVYGKMPTPVVQRRFLDKDPVARTASMILERTVQFQMESSTFFESTKRATLDYFLPGMGAVWFRYEPEFESEEIAADNADVEAKEHAENGPDLEDAEDVEEEGDGAVHERVAYERIGVDYVYFKDFLWSAARCWADVRWVAKRSFLTHSEIAERFFDNDLEKAKQITLDWTADRMSERTAYTGGDEQNEAFVKKAAIWEIWNKPDRTVYFVAPGSPAPVGLLEKTVDPLKLQGFWPTVEPLFATQTNDTLIPVPDYHEYQDQAQELDDLTDRISRITAAVKAAGVYDASFPALQRLLQQGQDNQLIPVDQWAVFAEKGGMVGAISLLPMKEIMEVLIRLYEARAQVKNDAYEITGISDIVRGQGESGPKTATEQRIKGQFATLRLQDRQAAVARFCRDGVRLMAELISEHFSEESLLEMSGYRQIVQDEMATAAASVPQQQAPQMPPQMGEPQMASTPALGMLGAPPDPIQMARSQAEQKALDEFAKAVELLRSDKLRGFRIDIETDSTIQVDGQADKEATTEMIGALFTGLQNAGPIIQAAPELLEPTGDTILFGLRRFRIGVSLEQKWSEAFEKLAERMKGPQPPSPEQIKAQAEIKKQEMETQRTGLEFQAEQKKAQDQAALDQQKMGLELQKLQAEMAADREKHQLEMEKMRMQMAAIAQKTRADMAKTQMQAQTDERKAEIEGESMERQAALGAEADERKHELSMEAAEKKTEAAGA